MPHLCHRRSALKAACGLAASAWLGTEAAANGQTVRVAVAANFAATMRELAAWFERETGHRVLAAYGSTGKFYAQLTQGAPFDLLLAADTATPQRLVREGLALAATRRTYATGRLVLFGSDAALVDSKGEVLRSQRFQRLSIANPKVAPYGLAAEQTLRALGLHSAMQSRIVRAESVAQVMQQVLSGNVQLGFVALSQIKGKADAPKRSSWLVPAELHAPIEQGMVLLSAAAAQPAALALHAWLLTEPARSVMRKFGYT